MSKEPSLPPPERQLQPTSNPCLQWLITDDGSRTLWDSRLDETYHSGCGAVSESMWVYLINSGVKQRLLEGRATSVFEYGFGTGTSFLLTAAVAEASGTRLAYAAVENDLLPADILIDLKLRDHAEDWLATVSWDAPLPENWLAALGQIEKRLMSQLREAEGHEHVDKLRLQLSDRVLLELNLGDGRREYPDVAVGRRSDAIYFDPFAPEKAPDLWTSEVMESAYKMLSPGGTLTSYCVKSSVRRTLTAVGFAAQRLKGPPGGKREVLLAIKPPNCPSTTNA